MLQADRNGIKMFKSNAVLDLGPHLVLLSHCISNLAFYERIEYSVHENSKRTHRQCAYLQLDLLSLN